MLTGLVYLCDRNHRDDNNPNFEIELKSSVRSNITIGPAGCGISAMRLIFRYTAAVSVANHPRRSTAIVLLLMLSPLSMFGPLRLLLRSEKRGV
jgi:hypothetical protein